MESCTPDVGCHGQVWKPALRRWDVSGGDGSPPSVWELLRAGMETRPLHQRICRARFQSRPVIFKTPLRGFLPSYDGQ
jgi:hypothetical protein